MITVNKLVPQGRGLAPVLVRRASQVELGWDERSKSRLEATDSAGRQLGIFLPRGTTMRGGDVLVAEDGSLVRVVAAPQPVLVVQACATHGTPLDLLRAAYHLGNRHVQVELREDRLLLEPDHVLAGMLRGNHLIVTEAQAAFEPEGGAYASAGHGHGHGHHGHGHGHDHGHAHGHAGDHAHEHGPAHEHESGQAHAQAHADAHDHDHAQAHVHDHRHDHGDGQKPGHGGRHGH